jgi:hypothetical protein
LSIFISFSSQVARIHKRLRTKVRKYSKNIEATNHLDVQFEINRNSSQNDHQTSDSNELLFQCAQPYVDAESDISGTTGADIQGNFHLLPYSRHYIIKIC